jgi:predicted hydrocarbon binding protein
MWSSLYNRGELRVISQTETSARIRLQNFPSEAAGCSRVTGWIERMAALTGVKDVKVEQVECFARGGTNCEWTLEWK